VDRRGDVEVREGGKRRRMARAVLVESAMINKWVAAFAMIAAVPGAARADSSASVDIQLNQAGQDLAAALGLDVGAFADTLRDQISSTMGLSEVGGFLRTFSNATSFSNRGTGVDYASNSERGILGIGANVAIATDLEGDVPAVGAAANITVMGGLNLKAWGYPQLTVYGNTFWRSAESEHLAGSIASVGAHVQYKMFTPTRGWKRLVVQWGGVDFTTGLEVAHWSLGLRGQLSTTFDVPSAGGETMATIGAQSGGRFDLSSTTATVPVEVTTSLRLFYFASLYAGLGVAAQVGSSSVDVGVDGSLTGSRDGGEVETIGAVSANGSSSQGPSLAGWHMILGAQVNLWRLKIFVQGTVEPTDRFSVALGTRLIL
jgi:hypothetical protein